jgi:hypothetical protein
MNFFTLAENRYYSERRMIRWLWAPTAGCGHRGCAEFGEICVDFTPCWDEGEAA